MKTKNRRRNDEINGGRRKNGRKKTYFSKLRPQKKKKTEATRGRSGSQIANARAEAESDQKNGRNTDECRPAAGFWRFFFYETAAGTLAADRPHASKPVCFNLCAFALKNQMVNEDPLENRQTKECRKHCIAHSRRILDSLRNRRRADVNERRLFFLPSRTRRRVVRTA